MAAERAREGERGSLSHPAIVQLPPSFRTTASSGHGKSYLVSFIKQHMDARTHAHGLSIKFFIAPMTTQIIINAYLN